MVIYMDFILNVLKAGLKLIISVHYVEQFKYNNNLKNKQAIRADINLYVL